MGPSINQTLQRRQVRAGFSLLELIVVLAVLALLAALVVPAVRQPSPRLVLRGVAHDVIRAAAASRAQAIRTGQITRLDVDVAARQVQADGLSEPLAFPNDVSVTAEAVHHTDAGPSTARFLFYPSGQSSGGDLTLAQADVTVRITINWITGHASTHTP